MYSKKSDIHRPSCSRCPLFFHLPFPWSSLCWLAGIVLCGSVCVCVCAVFFRAHTERTASGPWGDIRNECIGSESLRYPLLQNNDTRDTFWWQNIEFHNIPSEDLEMSCIAEIWQFVSTLDFVQFWALYLLWHRSAVPGSHSSDLWTRTCFNADTKSSALGLNTGNNL